MAPLETTIASRWIRPSARLLRTFACLCVAPPRDFQAVTFVFAKPGRQQGRNGQRLFRCRHRIPTVAHRHETKAPVVHSTRHLRNSWHNVGESQKYLGSCLTKFPAQFEPLHGTQIGMHTTLRPHLVTTAMKSPTLLSVQCSTNRFHASPVSHGKCPRRHSPRPKS